MRRPAFNRALFTQIACCAANALAIGLLAGHHVSPGPVDSIGIRVVVAASWLTLFFTTLAWSNGWPPFKKGATGPFP